VTRRAWIVLALGLVAAVVTAGAFARAGRSDFQPSKPQPGWGMFSAAEWKTLSLRLERRGFDAAGIRLVGATDTTKGRAFGLLAGRSRTGTTCVVPVTGTTLGATVCRLTRPFITGIVVEDKQHRRTGIALMQTGSLTTFAGGYVGVTSLRAFDAHNRTLMRLELR
jgi:hypothetical protein